LGLMVDGLWFRVQGSNRRNSGQTGHRTAPWPKRGEIPPAQRPAMWCGIAQWAMRIPNSSVEINRLACDAHCKVGFLCVWSLPCSTICSNAAPERGLCETPGCGNPRRRLQGYGRPMGPMAVPGGVRFLVKVLERGSSSPIQ